MPFPFLRILLALLCLSAISAAAEETAPLDDLSTVERESCPLVDKATIEKAFPSARIRAANGDASGACGWIFEHGANLMVQLYKRPNAAELPALFESYRHSIFAPLSRAAAQPKLGRKAIAGLSSEGAKRPEAELMVLDREALIMVSYYPGAGEKLGADTLASLVQIGRETVSRQSAADVGFGQCEWLPAREVAALLGPGKHLVQRLGPDNCIASAPRNDGILTVQIRHDSDPESFAQHRESYEKSCTLILLPEFGPDANARLDCLPRGGAAAVRVEMLKNGAAAMVDLIPPRRPGTARDVEAMKPLLRHVFGRL